MQNARRMTFIPQLRNKNLFPKLMVCFLILAPTAMIIWAYTKPFWARDRPEDALIPSMTPESSSDPKQGTSVHSIAHHVTAPEQPILVNFEPPDEPSRSGPGEGGEPYKLPPEKEVAGKISQSKYGMNMVCSDEISLDRTIPDLRHPDCKYWKYPENLPNASVVIVFHNEGFSTLMRTVHSVINRTPSQLLAEVLLVDDFSDRTELKSKLDEYIKRWNGKVRLVRNKNREGLITTRSTGAREAQGEVIVFLDAHCEVNKNWLPPLLTPIHKDRKTMTVPVIDGIDNEDFRIERVYQEGHLFKGIFEWGMLYKEQELSHKDVNALSNTTQPYRSPTHAGGLLAINREYFLELGAYDPGLLVWGGENFELSFKIWQCGGSIVWVPCSRVAHVYKSSASWSFGPFRRNDAPVVTINYKRVVETWMDEKYKEYFYTREPIARLLKMGDIGKQLELKKKLQCKSFKWFMDNVANNMTSLYPELPPNKFWGQLQNIGSKYCLDTFGRNAPTIITVLICSPGINNDQIFRLNTKGQLGIGERCVYADERAAKMVNCNLGSVDGPWSYNEITHVLYNNKEQKCLTLIPNYWRLVMTECNPTDPTQQWLFIEVRPNSGRILKKIN